jgi:hypothetical protein
VPVVADLFVKADVKHFAYDAIAEATAWASGESMEERGDKGSKKKPSVHARA